MKSGGEHQGSNRITELDRPEGGKVEVDKSRDVVQDSLRSCRALSARARSLNLIN